MTKEQKHAAVLEALGEAIAQRDDTIYWLRYELDEVKKKLAEAEAKAAIPKEKDIC